ncbi:hypothetical protein LSTR_LSTR001792 [Laodelphax striatellus]|uniref:Uncharacterized protein n=1 Tax=Laodelphax striatellus TaxID=195883 RepID=A0A482WFT5_LAOST|nr:hypothetical protein LSTR_LSTR001792 [Laodelphax striatellus]
MKLFGLLLKKCDKSDDSGKNKNKKIYVDDSDDEVYDHSKPKSEPKHDATLKTVLPDDSREIAGEDSELSCMKSTVSEEEKHPEVCPPCSGGDSPAAVDVQGTSGTGEEDFKEAINAPECVKVAQEFCLRQNCSSKYTFVTYQKPTKMQELAAESHYYYHCPFPENPIPALPVINGVAKKFGLGRGSIARFRYFMPSFMGWSAVVFVSGAYLSLHLIENGLPTH